MRLSWQVADPAPLKCAVLSPAGGFAPLRGTLGLRPQRGREPKRGKGPPAVTAGEAERSAADFATALRQGGNNLLAPN